MKESFDAIAAKLEENETGLSDLYAQFARTFPQDAAFWTELSRDELKHAGLIGRLRGSVAVGAIRPGDTTARREGIDMAMQYAASIAERCRRGEITRVQAHALARDIENAMLERKLLTVLGLASPESAAVVEELVRETAVHRTKINEALERLVQSR